MSSAPPHVPPTDGKSKADDAARKAKIRVRYIDFFERAMSKIIENEPLSEGDKDLTEFELLTLNNQRLINYYDVLSEDEYWKFVPIKQRKSEEAQGHETLKDEVIYEHLLELAQNKVYYLLPTLFNYPEYYQRHQFKGLKPILDTYSLDEISLLQKNLLEFLQNTSKQHKNSLLKLAAFIEDYINEAKKKAAADPNVNAAAASASAPARAPSPPKSTTASASGAATAAPASPRASTRAPTTTGPTPSATASAAASPSASSAGGSDMKRAHDSTAGADSKAGADKSSSRVGRVAVKSPFLSQFPAAPQKSAPKPKVPSKWGDPTASSAKSESAKPTTLVHNIIPATGANESDKLVVNLVTIEEMSLKDQFEFIRSNLNGMLKNRKCKLLLAYKNSLADQLLTESSANVPLVQRRLSDAGKLFKDLLKGLGETLSNHELISGVGLHYKPLAAGGVSMPTGSLEPSRSQGGPEIKKIIDELNAQIDAAIAARSAAKPKT